MKEFGFKIVDRDKAAITPIIDYALTADHPLEVGLYFNDPAAADSINFRLQGRHHPLNTHLDHSRYSIFDLENRLVEVEHEILRSRRIGSAYSITHVSTTPVGQRPEYRKALFTHLMTNLQRLDALCQKLDYHIHIENTFHGLGFYHELFEQVIAAKLGNIHFCFDIGHAKVWSGSRLEEWLMFLQELKHQGIQLHFHLHANRGLADEHLSFIEAEELGLDQPDWYTRELGYSGALLRIQQLFPDSRKIFEVPSEQALDNMNYVCSRLRDNRVAGAC